MPNKNYQRGYRVENKLVNSLKRAGWTFAARTAGSHSPADVIGITGNNVVFFQCKTNKDIVDKKNTEKLKDIAKCLEYGFAYNVWPNRYTMDGLHWERIA